MVDSFSDSSDSMETDSPMVLDTSIQSQPQQWRVPPLEQHKPETVDIFSAPEYAEVGDEVIILRIEIILF